MPRVVRPARQARGASHSEDAVHGRHAWSTPHIGRSGVEQAWESILRGRRGWVRLEHDVRGLLITRDSIAGLGPDRHRDPVPGRDLVLTLDMELMRAIDRAFSDLSADGTVAAILERYGVTTID